MQHSEPTVFVRDFQHLTERELDQSGGKGATLARLARNGYPVPEGFVILPAAFENDKLIETAWPKIQDAMDRIRAKRPMVRFAVRSSALAEDSHGASFAGEFESVLNLASDRKIREAIQKVRRSRHAERARIYGESMGRNQEKDFEMAVVIQEMVQADWAGVLFTVNPVTGGRDSMTGNAVKGLGDQLVSGEVNAETFSFHRPKGSYEGPIELQPQAEALFRMAERLEKELGGPQDIEWAVAENKVSLLQARPVTTAAGADNTAGAWNDSEVGDYLWTSTNVGEGVPDVMTPMTWSILKRCFDDSTILKLPGNHPNVGNIGGRLYYNLSNYLSLAIAVKDADSRALLKDLDNIYGTVPEAIHIPLISVSRWGFYRHIYIQGYLQNRLWIKVIKNIPGFLARAPEKYRSTSRRIQDCDSLSALETLWRKELLPFFFTGYRAMQACSLSVAGTGHSLRTLLEPLVDAREMGELMSVFNSAGEQVESMGSLLGLAKVARGEMTREAYLEAYGHRFAHEFEFSLPRPGEDPTWIDQQLNMMGSKADEVERLMSTQTQRKEEAWRRLCEKYPVDGKTAYDKAQVLGERGRRREKVRSVIGRLLWLVREALLKTGELSGLGDDIFFLYQEELQAVFKGDRTMRAQVPARRENHRRYSALPPYPSLISGRFDPFVWARDANRRIDWYDAHGSRSIDDPGKTIQGFAGSQGVVEGHARVIAKLEQAEALQAGEILVTSTTNVGWTPLFPVASAIVTDIGAPLSHAAIVARELGIPAVVGCGDATNRLKTGDRIRVNGNEGTVTILGDADTNQSDHLETEKNNA